MKIVIVIIGILILLLIIAHIILNRYKNSIYFENASRYIETLNFSELTNLKIGHLDALISKNIGKKIVLYCHGNAGNLYTRIKLFDRFRAIGLNLLLFDYSGYGKSEGSPTEKTLYGDSELVYEALEKMGYAKSKIIPYGESIGVPVAARLSYIKALDRQILQSGPYNIRSLIFDHTKLIKPIMSAILMIAGAYNDFDTAFYLKAYRGKTLILHGDDDTLIDFTHAEKLALCNKNCDLRIFGGGHNDIELDYSIIKKFCED